MQSVRARVDPMRQSGLGCVSQVNLSQLDDCLSAASAEHTWLMQHRYKTLKA